MEKCHLLDLSRCVGVDGESANSVVESINMATNKS